MCDFLHIRLLLFKKSYPQVIHNCEIDEKLHHSLLHKSQSIIVKGGHSLGNQYTTTQV